MQAAFSTRNGGVSEGEYSTLNLGGSTQDRPERVRTNRQRFFGTFGVSLQQLALAEQVHGAEVAQVAAPGRFPGVDALVTDQPGIALAIATADCAAVLLVDPDASVIGACHSGWRGTRGNVVGATIKAMSDLGADTERIHAFVSPCISARNFEVGEEVAAQFNPVYVSLPHAGARPHVDLKAVIRDQLLDLGVQANAIEVSSHCTVDRSDLFFSYRAEGGKTGRMLGFIAIDEEE